MNTFSINESESIERALNGSKDAFNDLVRQHATGVINVVFRMCGNMQLAEDAAQEAFIQAWIKIRTFRSGSSFKNWIYRIAINAAIDMLRKEKRIIPEAIEDIPLTDSNLGPEDMTSINENTKLVQAGILALPNASRSVLILREYEGMSYKNISSILDIPIGTVMSRLNYARKTLSKKLTVDVIHHQEVENV